MNKLVSVHGEKDEEEFIGVIVATASEGRTPPRLQRVCQCSGRYHGVVGSREIVRASELLHQKGGREKKICHVTRGFELACRSP